MIKVNLGVNEEDVEDFHEQVGTVLKALKSKSQLTMCGLKVVPVQVAVAGHNGLLALAVEGYIK